MTRPHDGVFDSGGTGAPILDPDRDAPLEPEEHAAQLAGLRRHLAGRSGRVLDLGCGGGRTLLPLVTGGHQVVGVDADAGALAACRQRLVAAGADAALHRGDLADPRTWPPGDGFDVVLCLGHTFMLLHEIDDAIACLAGARRRLAGGGVLLLDDLPGMLWPTVAAGDWPAGLAEDGSAQMTWAARDSVFAVRPREAIDGRNLEPGPGDQRCRLWTDGSLALAARLAGFSDPEPWAGECLLVMRPADDPSHRSSAPAG